MKKLFIILIVVLLMFSVSVLAEDLFIWNVGTENNKLEMANTNSTPQGEQIYDIEQWIGEDELNVLADGTYFTSEGKYDFQQYLFFDVKNNNQNEIVAYRENDDDITDIFFYVKSGANIGQYKLEFSSAPISTIQDMTGTPSIAGIVLDDFEGTKITLLGTEYSIVLARRPQPNPEDSIKLTLMNGAVKGRLDEGDEETYIVGIKEYIVKLTYVDATYAEFNVNGEITETLQVGDIYQLADGTYIGVSKIFYQGFAEGIRRADFFLGANKLVLRDNDVTDTGSSHELEVNGEVIDGADIIITGSDDNTTFRLTSIRVNMTAQDDYFVGKDGKLSDAIAAAGDDKEVLFTNNWDIEYKGLTDAEMHEIKLYSPTDRKYNLQFYDGDNNLVQMPLFYAVDSTNITMTEDATEKEVIINEAMNISKNDYFVITQGTASDGTAKTFVLQYKGADKTSATSPKIQFKNLGSKDTLEYAVDTTTDDTATATIQLGGYSWNVYNKSAKTSSDFDIGIDLNGDSIFSVLGTASAEVDIIDAYGLQIDFGGTFGDNNNNGQIVNPLLTNVTSLRINFTTPNSNDYDDQAPPIIQFTADATTTNEVTCSDFNINTGSGDLSLTPEGEENIGYGYTTMGAKWTYKSPSGSPNEFVYEYPKEQRLPQVNIVSEEIVKVGCIIPTNNMIITENTVFCPGSYNLADGIEIGADNVVLDCNGAVLQGNGGEKGITITGQKNVQIKNCHLLNYQNGFLVQFSENIQLFENYLFGRGLLDFLGNGIQLTASFNNNFTGNDISGFWEGIIFDSGSNNNILEENEIVDNLDCGLTFNYGSNQNQIKNNRLEGQQFNVCNFQDQLIEMRDNYWGTTNLDEITLGIYDFYDKPTLGIVNFEPFLNEPYSEELPDLTPPNITITNPINESTITGNSTWLNVTTNESAICFFSGNGLISDTMLTDDEIDHYGIEHYYNLTGLQNNSTYTVKVSCQDMYRNFADTFVTFSVGNELACEPNWVLEDNWSACVYSTQFKNYVDANECNLPESKPEPISQSCNDHLAPIISVTNPLNNSIVNTNLILFTTLTDEPTYCWESDFYSYPTNDTTPPVISNPEPTGDVSSTGYVELSLRTDEWATCKGNLNLDASYEEMGLEFSGYKVIHQKQIYLTESGTYTLFVKCKDLAENLMPDSYNWSFNFEYIPPQGGAGGGGGGGSSASNVSYNLTNQWEYNNLTDGYTYLIWASCKDQFGNEDTQLTRFSVKLEEDLTPPKITFNSPLNNTVYVNTSSLPINLSLSEEGYCSVKYRGWMYASYWNYNPESEKWEWEWKDIYRVPTDENNEINFAMENLKEFDREYTLTATCTDLSNNTKTETINFGIRDNSLTLDEKLIDVKTLYLNQNFTADYYITNKYKTTEISITLERPDQSINQFNEYSLQANSIHENIHLVYDKTDLVGEYKVILVVTDTEGNTITSTDYFKVFEPANQIVNLTIGNDELMGHYFDSDNNLVLGFSFLEDLNEMEEIEYIPPNTNRTKYLILPNTDLSLTLNKLNGNSGCTIRLFDVNPSNNPQLKIQHKIINKENINSDRLNLGMEKRYEPVMDGEMFNVNGFTDSDKTYQMDCHPASFWSNKKYYTFQIVYNLAEDTIDYGKSSMYPYDSPELVNSSYEPIKTTGTSLFVVVEDTEYTEPPTEPPQSNPQPSGGGGGGGGGGGSYLAQCNDKKDNDGDGLIDFPSDPGCSSKNDDDEINAAVESVGEAAVKKIEAAAVKKSTCTEDWVCTLWSECADGKRTRSCSDQNSCRTYQEKPKEIDFCKAKEEAISPAESSGTGQAVGIFSKIKANRELAFIVAAVILTVLGIIGWKIGAASAAYGSGRAEKKGKKQHK